QWGGMDMGDGLNAINADDIESIQVLKGAAGSALYGYRGGNGVIMITTKSGKGQQGLGIEVNNNFTVNNLYDYRDFQNVYGQGTQGVKPQTQNAAFQTYNQSWGSMMDGSEAINRLGNTYSYSPVDNRSEEHTSELQSRENLVCRLLLEKKNHKRKKNK